MIVKILKASATFAAVKYNTNKIDNDKGDLMKVANFGPLQALGNLRPQDYINYLNLLSAQNRAISKPQFHAIISAKGKSFDKQALTVIAEKWLQEMGYGKQPYLIIFHKDTENNHIHMVSARVSREGKKISSAFEYKRAIAALNHILGLDYALAYRFSTMAQFQLLLELKGFPPADINLTDRMEKRQPDKTRALWIASLFREYRDNPDFINFLKENHGIEVVFHSSGGQRPYGYTIVDHQEKNVFKGSEVMPLKELLNEYAVNRRQEFSPSINPNPFPDIDYKPINIADDIDDEAVHGKRRHNKIKSRRSHH